MERAKKIQEPVPYYQNGSIIIAFDVANKWGVWMGYEGGKFFTKSGTGIKVLLNLIKERIIPYYQTILHGDTPISPAFTLHNIHLLWAHDKYKNHNTTAKLANYKGQIQASFSNLDNWVYIHEVNENQAYNFLRFKNGIVDFTPNPRGEKKTTTLDTYNKVFDLEEKSQDVADAWMLAHCFIAEQNGTMAYLAFRVALSLPIEKRVSCNWWEKELWPQEKEEK